MNTSNLLLLPPSIRWSIVGKSSMLQIGCTWLVLCLLIICTAFLSEGFSGATFVSLARGSQRLRKRPFSLLSFLSANSAQSRHVASSKKDLRLMSSEGSVHLQLRNIASDVSSTTENGPMIRSFLEVTTRAIVAATVGSKSDLEHFTIHHFGRNYSLDNAFEYVETILRPDDHDTIQLLTNLWKQGRYLSKSKHFKDDWQLDRTRPAITIHRLLESNRRRINSIMNNTDSVHSMRNFLQQQTGFEWAHHCHNAGDSKETTLSKLKSFAIWFKKEFPYYNSGCLQPECGNKEDNQYLGTVYPSAEEQQSGKAASRTELYVCAKCAVTSRFPRFNAMDQVLCTRRGRCGEYSVLALQMLQALGYATRWVVDRDDHVWVEVQVVDVWTHLDPCEAAVDEPLLYQSWGKNQTYILAYTPGKAVDVTLNYTEDKDGVYARRLAEGVSEEQLRVLIESEQALLS